MKFNYFFIKLTCIFLNILRLFFFLQKCKNLLDINIFIHTRKYYLLNQNYKYSLCVCNIYISNDQKKFYDSATGWNVQQ